MVTINAVSATALSNAGVLAPAALMLLSLAGLVRYKILASTVSVNFQLRSLESVELDRSLLLYKKVHDRRAEILKLAEQGQGDLLTRYRQRNTVLQKFADELEDIEAYGRHLRATIVRLRRKPVQRLRCWLHVRSAQLAFGRSLMAYVVISSAGLVGLYGLQQLFLLDEMETSFALSFHWEHMHGPMLYANWLGAGFMLAAWPAVYFYRRAELNRRYRVQLRVCKRFASADPDRLMRELRTERACEEQQEPSDQVAADGTCFDVLGVSPAASINEVKEAYRERVKQSHPDRVQGMSNAFTALAETETKKLNIAYQEALMALQGLLTA
jgi:DnaJ domain